MTSLQHAVPAISVIIPLYNAQAYVQRFVESLQTQTFQNFEAIFVNDQSPDQSAEILRGMASSDPRIKVVTHPRNLGAGAARNTGIRAATGDAICFADPDDLLPNTSLEVRYSAFKHHGAVVRACHIEKMEEGRIIHHESRPLGLDTVCTPKEVASKFGISPFLCAHWTWLFPTKMLQRVGIYNEENMRTAEDIMFLIRAFYSIQKLIWIDEIAYFWIKRENSLSNTYYTTDHYLDYFKCIENFYSESEKNEKILLADSFFNDYLSCYIPHLLKQIIDGKSKEQDALVVLHKILQLAEKHDILQKYGHFIQKRPLQYVGFFRVWHFLADQNSSLIQRLINGQNFISHQHKVQSDAALARHGLQGKRP